jgi:HAD superfamily hydrolase (TIGR01549 family)
MHLKPTSSLIKRYSDKFSSIVVEKVISSAWVPGVVEYLEAKKEGQLFIVTSATPKDELIYILKELKLLTIFDDVFGSPITKSKAIKNCLKKYGIDPILCLMYGDAKQDFIAAKENDIPFIFREHHSNQEFKKQYKGISIRDFHEAPR